MKGEIVVHSVGPEEDGARWSMTSSPGKKRWVQKCSGRGDSLRLGLEAGAKRRGYDGGVDP
jgi:hypothetical protein